MIKNFEAQQLNGDIATEQIVIEAPTKQRNKKKEEAEELQIREAKQQKQYQDTMTKLSKTT